MFDTYGTIVFQGETIQDITTRYILEAKTNEYGTQMFQEYIIKDWEAPEIIAYKLYGNCDYVWIIFLCNNIVNPFTDWLLTEDEMEEFVADKYGDKARDIHHYELNGLIYRDPVVGATPVSNSAYEYDKNEKKRKIRVVPASVIRNIEEALRKV